MCTGPIETVAGMFNANTQAGAAKDAAQIQANSQYDAQQLQYRMFQEQSAEQAPWRDAGKIALGQQQAMIGKYPDLSTAAYQQSDYDKWIMQQGANALSASGAASGMYGSGNLGTALQNYGQNQAGSQYQQWRSNQLGDYTNQYNQLAGLSGTGQVSAQNIGAMGMATAQNMGQYGVGAGNALAAGQIGSTNAWANALGNMQNQGMSGFGTAMKYMQNQQYMNAFGNQDAGYLTGNQYDAWMAENTAATGASAADLASAF